MGDEECKIYLDAMKEIYMMAVINLKRAGGKCPPTTQAPDKPEFKVDMVLLQNHAPTNPFDM